MIGECLAPAGSFEALQAAIENGADAVYLAGKSFGARASAANFDHQQMEEAVKLAHRYGVKIYVTVNTLIKDCEFAACLAYIEECAKLNVDAFIIQDLGLLFAIRNIFPDLECHASTQMHIHNVAGVKETKKLGLQRAVAARETPLSLLGEMCRQGIEIEVFVQGAYCVSYSGQCLMSQNIGGRSGNRGECAQSCRLPYELYCEDKKVKTKGNYLLSPKDLNALDLVDELMKAKVASFKIEGRLKRAEYVALMTSLYRQAIDASKNNYAFKATEAIKDEMRKIFNRGFSEGYLTNQKGSRLMNPLRPNHVGIEIGEVLQVKDKITLRLSHDLHQHDGIRILNEQEDAGCIVNYLYRNGQLINHAKAGETVEINRIQGVKKGDKVLLTSDSEQLERLASTYQKSTRKIQINGRFKAVQNQPIELTFWDEEGFKATLCGINAELALKTPISEERIIQQCSKLGGTAYQLNDLKIILDERTTFPISALNELRRSVLNELDRLRSERILPFRKEKLEFKTIKQDITPQVSVSVATKKQYDIVARYPVHIDVKDKSLLCDEVGYIYPRVQKHEYEEHCGVINEIGALGMQLHNKTAGPYLNCRNAYTAYFLFQKGVRSVALSLECSDDDISQLLNEYRKINKELCRFEVLIYGRMENMIMENCPINTAILDNDKQNCQLCKQHQYFLKDRKGRSYPLKGDEDCLMHLYHYDTVDKIEQAKLYLNQGISDLRIDFTFEDAEETKQTMERVKRVMQW